MSDMDPSFRNGWSAKPCDAAIRLCFIAEFFNLFSYCLRLGSDCVAASAASNTGRPGVLQAALDLK